jgi:DNA adenine methylase
MKWAGGKTALLPTLLDLFPKRVRTYYEPFIGGGALFFALAAEGRFERAVINDWNDELVTAYRTIRDFPEELITKLSEITDAYKLDARSTFEWWRALHTESLDPITRAARLLFLNRTCFNGLYRVNKTGKFNVPFGKYKNPRICDPVNLRACSAILDRWASIKQGDFADACADAKHGDLVYFDPPYVPVNATSDFTSYTSNGFGIDAQYRLAALFKDLVERGVAVVASNSDTEIVRTLYEGFELHPVLVRRPINSKANGRGAISELIIVGRRSPSTWRSGESIPPISTPIEVEDTEAIEEDSTALPEALAAVVERPPYDIDDDPA